MKIQCNVCVAAEATVFCCADEAALCLNCDQKVHAANKVAGKHQRVRLSSSPSQMPKCDICQETVGYFFCIEDRALLCRKCDVAIHATSSLVSVHKRFLLTGVKVDLEATKEAHKSSSASGKTSTNDKILEFEPHSLSKGTNNQASVCGNNSSSPSNSSISQWQLDEFIGLGDFTQGYNYLDIASSKTDNGKLGVSDLSQMLQAGDVELEGDETLGQVPSSTFWAVPQIRSLPTITSALHSPKNYQNAPESAGFVPDISNYHHNHESHVTNSKRRRQF